MTDPLGGAGGADPNAGQGAGTGGQGAGDGGTGTGQGAGTGETGTTGQSAQTFTKEEYDSLRARMVAADQRASQREAELAQLRDKDVPEMQKLTRDLAAATEKATALQATNADLQVQIAFLTDNTNKWRNPGTALKLLDRTKITVNSDGTVDGMKDALKALATSDPYLLEDTSGADGNGAGGTTGTTTPPLGTPPANGGVNNGAKATKDATASRFPVVRTRLG